MTACRARFVRSCALVLALLLLPRLVTAAGLTINEIHYNPPGSDPTVHLEFIELFNAGPDAADLAGYELDFGPAPFVFPAGTAMAAGDYLVVAENIQALFAATGYTAQFAWDSVAQGNLDNGGERIVLRDGPQGTGTVVDAVDYDDDPPWPPEPDGNGPTLELRNPALDNDGASSWLPSVEVNGTPGRQNSVYTEAPTLAQVLPAARSAVETLPEVTVVFSRPVSGVRAEDLLVGDSPAAFVAPPDGPADTYTFAGFAAPAPGAVTLTLLAGDIQADGVPFEGDAWNLSVGLVVVINEIHYHPVDPFGDAEFVELYNTGSVAADLSGWSILDGLDIVFPDGTLLAPDGYLVVARDPQLVADLTGYGDAWAWEAGGLANGGERLALADAAGNEIDVVQYSDGGRWPGAADGDGPSLELVNPRFPNEFAESWQASAIIHGTPGAPNSIYQAGVAPLILDVVHNPAIPVPGATVTVTALVLDDSPTPQVTLYWRRDQDPTVAYSASPMWDDGLHGDGAANDRVYGAFVAGLGEGERLDFTLRASDGQHQSAAPAGHDSLQAGEYPAQTFLCKFSAATVGGALPHYHLITTQRTRNRQTTRDETEYDATFLSCDATGQCEIFYNVTEHYRGQSSLYQDPPSFRVNFPADHKLETGPGYKVVHLNLLGQQPYRQAIGYPLFEAAGCPASKFQLVRLNTNPLSHTTAAIPDHQNMLYGQAEVVDADFLASQDGDVLPERFPDRCSESRTVCDGDGDCPAGETCVESDDGNLYRGRITATLAYLGYDPAPYRLDWRGYGYQKITNESEDDWHDLMALVDALTCSSTDGGVLCTEDTYGATYEQTLDSLANTSEWTRWFALHRLLWNTEGGIYFNSGDDYFLYFAPQGDGATFIPWDLDATFANQWAGPNEPIWSAYWQPAVSNFLRNNAYTGRFLGALCEALDTYFSVASMNARIDAVPDEAFDRYAWQAPQGLGPRTKQGLKDWVAARHAYVSASLVFASTLEGVPASPYRNPDPVLALHGRLGQCGTYRVLVNGVPADAFDVAGATWSHRLTLEPGRNPITFQTFDRDGEPLERLDAVVYYQPPGGPLRMAMPTRMVKDKTLTLKAEIVDQVGSFGQIDWQTWNVLGTVSARRLSDGSPVPTSITVFETLADGVGGGTPPADSIRFYNGVGSVSLTLDEPDAVVGETVAITVTVAGRSATRNVLVLDNVPTTFTALSGTLSGANLDWGPDDGVIHLTGDTTVPAGSTLTIRPGTLVMVDPGGAAAGTVVWVQGSVQANGTAAEPIFFFPTAGPAAMMLPQDAQNNFSSWRGLYHSGSGTSSYQHVFLTGAGNGSISGHPRPPVLRFYDAHSVFISDFVAADAPGKILHTSSNNNTVTVRRSLFSRCGIGGEFFGSPVVAIEDSWFTRIGRAPEPNGVDGDMLHFDGSQQQTVRRCIFSDGGDDVFDGAASTPITVENTIVYDARDKLLSLYGCCGTMYNVLAFDLSGAYDNSGGTATQSTFALPRNFSSGYAYSIQRTILWQGSASTCNGDVDYTIVGSPSHLGCGIGNFSEDPQFVDTAANDYNLRPTSPALHAGPNQDRIGWLGFPNAEPCSPGDACDDLNLCTEDSCGLGVCVHTPIVGCIPCAVDADCDYGNACVTGSCQTDGRCTFAPTNEGAACDDGWACTTGDRCIAGVCSGSEDCPPGLTCDPTGLGTCEGLRELTFQDGRDGYAGTQDTYLRQVRPSRNYGSLDNFEWDGSDGTPPGQNIGLLRFDDVFGEGPRRIPQGATVTRATLTLVVFNPSLAPAGDIHEALDAWDETTATWDNYGGEPGVDPDERGAFVAAAPVRAATASLDVTASLQAWAADPTRHHGWIFSPQSPDGAQVWSSEAAEPGLRPKLTVRFGVTCTSDAACDDGLFCNGLEACDETSGGCVSGVVACPGLLCNEAELRCVECLSAADCDDGDACTGVETCDDGQCTLGTPPVCDDGASCTADRCDPLIGCVSTDSCPLGEVCHPGLDRCWPGPTPLIPRGATWAYLDTGEFAGDGWTQLDFDDSAWRYGPAQLGYGDGDEATVVHYGDDPENKFVTTYFRHSFVVPEPERVTQLALRLLRDDGAAVYLNGVEVRRDGLPEGEIGYETLASATVSGDEEDAYPETAVDPALLVAGVNIMTVELHQVSVTSSDASFDLELLANPGCAGDADCDDADVCDGVETCQFGLCTPGTALDCNDGIACTADLCDPLAGCHNPDDCGLDETCDRAAGTCGVPVLPIVAGDTWAYLKGTAEPGAAGGPNWAKPGFSGDAWLRGPGSFGYGSDCAPYGTVLSDMQNGYASLYVRRGFFIADPAAVRELTLTVDYDDGFVAYLNGTVVARRNVSGVPPAFDTLAASDHECSGAAVPQPAETFPLHRTFDLPLLLRAGTNVLAIQAHNLTLGSSDFTLAASLDSDESTCTGDGDCDDGLYCNGLETCNPVTERCHAGSEPCTDPARPLCDESLDLCGTCLDDTDCLDNNPCNGSETCTDSVCVAGTGAVCDDGLACTLDYCWPGQGCRHKDHCPAGEYCQPAVGSCAALATLPLSVGAGWNYWLGRSEPTPDDLTAWTRLAFDDSAWPSGASGLGYDLYAEAGGVNPNGDYAPFIGTVLDDMRCCGAGSPCSADCYTSVYLRARFYVAEPGALQSLELPLYVDDGAVVYLNGTEVFRLRMTGSPPAFDALASANPSSSARPPSERVVDLSASIPLLQPGANVVAIQAHNVTRTSRDFLVVPQLRATLASKAQAVAAAATPSCVADPCGYGLGVAAVFQPCLRVGPGACPGADRDAPTCRLATQFQLGAFDFDVPHAEGTAEYPAEGRFSEVFDYVVTAGESPTPDLPAALGGPAAALAARAADATDRTRELRLHFTLATGLPYAWLHLSRYGAGVLEVALDGRPLATPRAAHDGPAALELALPALAKGAHVLTLRHAGPADAGVWLDALRLVAPDCSDPGPERCLNGLDDDCNCLIDDGFALWGQPCETGAKSCPKGQWRCAADERGLTCTPRCPEATARALP